MKNMRIKNIILTIVSSMALASCNFLNFDETDGLKTKDDMYKYFNTTENMLTHVYSFIPQDFGALGGAMRDCGSDDAEYGNVGANVQNFNNGNWSAVKVIDSSWNLFNGIRAANGFIEEIENVDFSRYQYEPNYKNWMRKLKLFPYEARVLRAHFFFELARRYGDIPMPLTVLSKEEANSIEKTKFADIIRFIVKECDEAAEVLPLSYVTEPGQQIGRITKGFALAVKSKALLYAASELHNPTMQTDLWKESASAALDIIQLDCYALDKEESANNVKSKEIVLMRMGEENRNFELNNFPIRFTEGSRSGTVATATFPSQNLVDAFQTIDGYPVTLEDIGWVSEDPKFDPKNPYANRDPRFYRTILTNGAKFKDKTIETYAGGADDDEITAGGSPTGYFLKKYIQETTSFTPENIVSNKHHWVVYRYAETLLTYAESMANAFPENINYTDATYPHSALWALNQVRENAGMPAVAQCNHEEFIKHLRNEWRVEFAFEDHRFWDVRRWKIANDTQRELVGVKIKKNQDGTFDFFKNIVESRVWKDCMYLYPIPQNELFINTNLNPQNTGW